ncbi:MAG: DUF1080 domain-containing protein [Planctomycetota bacterium]|nr:DUF1080 domain-containing protein [Planctomycetota bacterium]
MKKRNPFSGLLLFSLVASFTSNPTFAETKAAPELDKDAQAAVGKMNEWVGSLTAKPFKERQEIYDQIIKLGSVGLDALCGQLVNPATGDDSSARLALRELSFYVLRPGATASERELYVLSLHKILKAEAGPDVQAFACRELQLTGRAESVGSLAALLTVPELTEPSAMSLLAISKHAARAEITMAVRAAYSKLTDKADNQKVTLIRALAALRDKNSLPAFNAAAASDHSNLRQMGLYALANLGDPTSEALLLEAAASKKISESQRATSWLWLYARRLNEEGHADKAVTLCRKVFETRSGPADGHVQSSALYSLYEILGDGAIEDLLASLENKSVYVQAASAKLLMEIKSNSLGSKLAARLKNENPASRKAALEIIAARGDEATAGAVKELLKDKDPAVRLQAIIAYSKVAKAQSLDALLDIAQKGSPEEQALARNALIRLPGEEASQQVAEMLKTAKTADSKTAIIEALQARNARKQVSEILLLASDKDSKVRGAALKALKVLASPSHVPALLKLLNDTDPEDQDALVAAIASAGSTAGEDERLTPILDALAEPESRVRLPLLKVLSRIGGKKAIAPVLEEISSEDEQTQDAAIRALTDWPDDSAVEPLLKLATTSESLIHKVLALRGVMRVITSANISPEAKTSHVKTALAAAERTEDKKMILGSLGSIRHPHSLKLAASLVSQPELKAEAINAVMRIACPQSSTDLGLTDSTTYDVLKELVGVVTDANAKNQIQEHLSRFPQGDIANLARNKPVMSAPKHQGNNVPTLAVDGVADQSSVWFGDGSPAWLEVDLQQTVKIDTAHVYFYYSDGRYYQYAIEVSTDQKTWKKVVDRSGTTELCTAQGHPHRFDPIEARWVKLHIYKNSANPAVHVMELKVYAEGTAPETLKKFKPNEELPGSDQVAGAARTRAAPPDGKVVNPSITPYALHKKDENGKVSSGIPEEEFQSLFDGKTLNGWQGSLDGYFAENGILVCKGGQLFTEKEYSDFVFRFEFKLPPGGNNGLGIRAPSQGNAAYAAMELQILENTAEKYATLAPYQYHGSIYGVVPARRGFQKKPGEWNYQEVIAIGHHVKVILNGEVITDAFLDQVYPMDGKPHPGLLNKKGFIGFLGHGDRVEFKNIRIKDFAMSPPLPDSPQPNVAPPGYIALFNGKDLNGWKGLVANPRKRAEMTPEQLANAQEKADEVMRNGWSIQDGVLVFSGKGQSLCTVKDFADFDLYVDWKIHERGDSGIYLRGSPQVQIWDPNQHKQGSGGLYNNSKNPRNPTLIADNPIGEWNTFYIRMVGENVTVYLNGKLAVDDVPLENYWDRKIPIYRSNQIELQNHGNTLYFKNVYLRELPH